MQIVSLGDNLHTVTKPIFWKREYYNMSSAENFAQNAKRSAFVVGSIMFIFNYFHHKENFDCFNP